MWNIPIEIIINGAIIPPLLWLYFRLRVKKIREYSSEISGKITIAQKYNKELVLLINNYDQGVTINDKSIKNSYWYLIAEKAIQFCLKKKDAKILMLGLGGNTIPSLIAQANLEIHQTLVEIDPIIIGACREYFGLDRTKNCTVLNTDAYQLLSSNTSQFKDRFDIIIVDIFIGRHPYVDSKSAQPGFIQILPRYLKKGGIIIFNRPADTENIRQENEKLKKYLQSHFKTVVSTFIKDPRGYKNDIILVQ